MNIAEKHIVYFLGIGGIGMSALARWFVHAGHKVAGYDKTPSDLTKQLQAEGIDISFNEKVTAIPDFVMADQQKVLVVITPAIPKDHPQWQFFIEKGYDLQKRAQVLGEITSQGYAICVAGTHGKTTTTAMLSHIFYDNKPSVAAFVGGIMSNYDSNLLIKGKPGLKTIFICEADEYDRSFHQLHPDLAIITSADPDHLDVYGDNEAVKKSFQDFSERLPDNGNLILKSNLTEGFEIRTGIKMTSYGDGEAQARADNIRIENGCFVFDYKGPNATIANLQLLVPGFHNVENAVAAITAALACKVSPEAIKESLTTFEGVKRRFQYILRNDKFIFIDDYAHHPSELEVFIKSVKSLYPSKKFTAIFQPHLYSRTRDFSDSFAQSLSKVDRLVLLEIYPARELPIEGVTSAALLEQVPLKDKQLLSKEELQEWVRKESPELLATIGAGDIDRLVEPIKNSLLER